MTADQIFDALRRHALHYLNVGGDDAKILRVEIERGHFDKLVNNWHRPSYQPFSMAFAITELMKVVDLDVRPSGDLTPHQIKINGVVTRFINGLDMANDILTKAERHDIIKEWEKSLELQTSKEREIREYWIKASKK